MNGLISHEELPKWVPGRLLSASDGLGWKRVASRSYHYDGQDVIVPAMRDFMLVTYSAGRTPMGRRFDGRWTHDTLGPGAASLLTRAQRAYWHWRDPIDVTHVYLSGALVAEVASEVMDCSVSEVSLNDILRAEDPIMTATIQAIAQEARVQGLGGPLYVDAMARGLIVHLLRRYASIRLPTARPSGTLSPREKRVIMEYIDAELAMPLDLKGMAEALGLTPCCFAKRFRQGFGKPPYAFVTARRLDRAKRLLATTNLPVKAVAADCGFTDQAHLTRMFSTAFGVTPAAFRRRAT